MRHIYALILVELDVLHQVIRVRLFPISTRARRTTYSAQRAAIHIVVVSLHESGSAPCVAIESLDAVLLSLF